MFDRILLWSHLVLEFVCWKIFNHSFNFIPCVWSVHILDCTFLRICPCLLGCSFYWHIVVHSSLMVFCISVVWVVTFPFTFPILLIWALSLFLLSLAKGLSLLFIFSKNQLLVSLIFSIFFSKNVLLLHLRLWSTLI